MEDHRTNPEAEGEEGESLERLDDAEDRISGIEEELRLRAMEERLSGLESNHEQSETGEQLPRVEGEGERELRLAVAAVLKNEALMQAGAEFVKETTQSIKEWIGLKSKAVEGERMVALHAYYAGLAFGAFLLSVFSFLLWHDKLSKEVAAGLFGSLIGYWYGRDKPKS